MCLCLRVGKKGSTKSINVKYYKTETKLILDVSVSCIPEEYHNGNQILLGSSRKFEILSICKLICLEN